MHSTFLGIEIGKRSLLAHHQGLNVIGQNLSNADNPDYSRQRITFTSLEPLYRPDLTRVETPGRIGQGVIVSQIRRERDIYLDGRIQQEISQKNYWQQNQLHLADIENIQNALGVGNFQTHFDNFWKSWQELAQNASEPAIRQELLTHALTLTDNFRSQHAQLNNLRYELNNKIIAEADEINTIILQISKANRQIRSSQILGDNPNDILDQRDALVEKLSERIDVSVSYNDEDEFMVHSGPRILIQGHKYQTLDQVKDLNNGGLIKLVWSRTREDFTTERGSLAAHIKVRDENLVREIRNLDTMATNLIFSVNDIHRQGANQYGKITGDFFTYIPFSSDGSGIADTDSDGIFESSLIYQVIGGEKLNPKDIVGDNGSIRIAGSDGKTTDVNYFLTDRIEIVLERLNNSQDSLNFQLNHEGRLEVKTRSNNEPYPFSIQSFQDTGQFLSGIAKIMTAGSSFSASDPTAINSLHPEAKFYRSPIQSMSSYIDINSQIKDDSNLIAAREIIRLDTGNNGKAEIIPKGIQDGNIAQKISEVRYNHVLLDNKKTFDEFYIHSVTRISSELAQAQSETERYDAVTQGLQELRQSVSGVNIDEELAQMIAFQNGYQAGARIVKMMNEVFDVLMQI